MGHLSIVGPLFDFLGGEWEVKRGWFLHDKYLGIICQNMNYFVCIFEKYNFDLQFNFEFEFVFNQRAISLVSMLTWHL